MVTNTVESQCLNTTEICSFLLPWSSLTRSQAAPSCGGTWAAATSRLPQAPRTGSSLGKRRPTALGRPGRGAPSEPKERRQSGSHRAEGRGQVVQAGGEQTERRERKILGEGTACAKARRGAQGASSPFDTPGFTLRRWFLGKALDSLCRWASCQGDQPQDQRVDLLAPPQPPRREGKAAVDLIANGLAMA